MMSASVGRAGVRVGVGMVVHHQRIQFPDGFVILNLSEVEVKNLRFFVADFILSHFDKLRACPEFIEGTGGPKGSSEWHEYLLR